MPAEESKRLGAACAFYGLAQESAHRALGDALDAHRLYQKLVKKHGAEAPEAFAAKPLIALFTANPETIALGTRALHIICLGFIVSAVSVTASGALEGLGKGFSSFIISLLRYVAVIIPAAFILCHTAGPSFVWHAFWITEALTAVVAAFVYRQASK